MVNVAKIEMLIKAKGWSNSYFCGLFGKNRGWIRDWKHGKGLPDANMLQGIADKLETTADYLTDKTDIKEKPAAKSDELYRLSRREKELLLAFRKRNKDVQDAALRTAGVDPDSIPSESEK